MSATNILGYQTVLSKSLLTRYGRSSGLIVNLKKRLPHIVLDSKGNNLSFFPSMPVTFSKHQRLNLEGNFSSSFRVYALPGYEEFTLSILTPDVMQALKHLTAFDMEIINKNIFMIVPDRVGFDKKIQNQLLEAAEIILKELNHKLKSWSKANEASVAWKYLDYQLEEPLNLWGKGFKSGGFWVICLCAIFFGGIMWTVPLGMIVSDFNHPWYNYLATGGFAALIFPGWPIYYATTRKIIPLG